MIAHGCDNFCTYCIVPYEGAIRLKKPRRYFPRWNALPTASGNKLIVKTSTHGKTATAIILKNQDVARSRE